MGNKLATASVSASVFKTPLLWLLLMLPVPAWAVSGIVPVPCVGGTLPVGTFKIDLLPPQGGTGLPIESVNAVEDGDILKYEPVNLSPTIRDKAQIGVVLVPAAGAKQKKLQVLEAKPARAPAIWTMPAHSSVVGVLFGPQGLDMKKFSQLVKKDPELIPELAAYAQQTATVNALINTLSQYDQSPPGSEDLGAVLKGFSSQYGVGLPQLNSHAPPSQQASQLLDAVMPSVANYNPASGGRSMALQQSSSLAGSLAMLFYGSPVGLAAGGAAMLENLHTMISPSTDFRAAFVQHTKTSDLELCSQNQTPKARTRPAYLWMLEIPDAPSPSVSLAETPNIPLQTASTIKVSAATNEQLRQLPRAREWQLKSAQKSAVIPVKVAVGSLKDTLSLDLAHTTLPAGEYRLAAMWDWKPFEVKGMVNVRPFGDFSTVRPTSPSEDRLVVGNGPVKVKLEGADFEFVQKVAIEPRGQIDPKSTGLTFTLPKGPDHSAQSSLETEIDTSALSPGPYALLLTQTDGKTQSVPLVVHPPNPIIEGLPLRVNLGETHQELLLHGTGLERIKQIQTPDATWTIAPPGAGNAGVTERKAVVRLLPDAKEGEVLSASMSVEGLSEPVVVPDLAKVAGPLPQIVYVDASFANPGSVGMEKGEIPAGSDVSFAVHTKNAGGHPALDLGCANAADTKRSLRLSVGDRTGSAELDLEGDDILFLSLDPGIVGEYGCVLTAAVSTPDEGVSDPYKLGRVIQTPQIDKFSLTDEKSDKSLYVGILTGRNLQMISKTGWNSRTGYPAQGIPTPVPGNAREQTLRVALPWPPPSPQAPIYIWLRGEKEGRKTTARY